MSVALTNRVGRPNEAISLNSPAEAASETTMTAALPDLRRAGQRLSELLEGSVR